MLVLSRRLDEEIIIPNPGPGPIRIKLVEVRAGKARIGVIAPAATDIWRAEIWEEKQAVKEADVQAPVPAV